MTDSKIHIRYLERNEIDIIKWDRCINDSLNCLIYARSFYLDIMSKKWSALVLNDYEYVMPLTWNRKYGFNYLYQPAFTAQLGVFFLSPPVESVFEAFFKAAKARFRFCEIHLNYLNTTNDATTRKNYILDLNFTYHELRNGYKKRLFENLLEADQHHLSYNVSRDFRKTIKLFRTSYGNRLSAFAERRL